MTDKKVQIIDAGTGNLQSVFNALSRQDADIKVISEPENININIRTVLPGVGAFRKFMDGLNMRGLIDPIRKIAEQKTPLLGICVGMQALFQTSTEMGQSAGLGLIPGAVIRFPDKDAFKIPHTGWNQVAFGQGTKLFKGIKSGTHFYFNHSFFCNPLDSDHQSAHTDYVIQFTSAVASNNIFGVQFHPEKSQTAGLQMLANFLEMRTL